MSGLLDEIREQPVVIRQTAESLATQLAVLKPYAERLRRGDLSRVILTGMGGSFAAATLCQLALVEQGITALAVESSELIYHYQPLLNSKTLLIIISQSGRSVEIVRLLDRLDQVEVIGITNTPDSPLAERSTHALIMQAGGELTVSSKTYTCTLAVLHALADVLTGSPVEDALGELHEAADAIEQSLMKWEQDAHTVAAQIAQAQFIVFLGRGISRTSALAGALVTKETAKIPTEGMLGGQFRHGPIEMLAPGVVLVVFMGADATRSLNMALVEDVQSKGGQVITIGDSELSLFSFEVPALDDRIMPIVEIVPVQLLAAELAVTRGFIPGQFRYGSKVTTTE